MSQIPFTTFLAWKNSTYCKQSFQNRNELTLATRETQFTQHEFPPLRRHSTKSHHPKIEPELFALNHPRNQLLTSCSNNHFHFKNNLEINLIDKNEHNMPSRKRTTNVRFDDAPRTANQHFTLPATSRSASQQSKSPSSTRAAISTQITTLTSPALSSNISTPLTLSLQLPMFDYIVNKVFSKSLIASLTSKDAVLKEVRDCTLTNNESRLKAFNPYIHSYWRDLHVRSGCVCFEKVAIPNVLREALIAQTSLQPTSSAMANPTIQAKISSNRNRRSPSYYGFESSSSDLTTAAQPKLPGRTGDVDSFQPPPASVETVVETVQNVAEQQQDEVNISPIIGAVSPPTPYAPSILKPNVGLVYDGL